MPSTCLSQYSHGGHGWNLKLREAVSLLETTYTLSYNVSYGIPPSNEAAEKKAVNLSSDKGKDWWSQRDLNPCLNHDYGFAMFFSMLSDFTHSIHRRDLNTRGK